MPKSNGAPGDSPKPPPAITSLTVSGFKSIVEEQTLAIRPLTLLAGANSSGKSSMMQPLLLLKQTLEAPFDPGPLLLDGPNVRFTAARQFRPSGSPRGQAVPFMVWLELSDGTGFIVTLLNHPNEPIALASNVITGFQKPIIIDTRIRVDDLVSFARPSLPDEILQRIKARRVATRLRVARHKFFLTTDQECHTDLLHLIMGYERFKLEVGEAIMGLIHVPGPWGNPERTCSVTAVAPAYRGTFDRHVASLIARWGGVAGPGRAGERRPEVARPDLEGRGEGDR